MEQKTRDPLAELRGKTLELTAFERQATKEQLADVVRRQREVLNAAASQVLTRLGVPKDHAAGIPCQFRIRDGVLMSIEVVAAPAPATPAKPTKAAHPMRAPAPAKKQAPRGKRS